MTLSEHEALRRSYEELGRRTVADRLAFADRVQEVLDHAQQLQHEVEARDQQIARLEEDAASLRARIDELHAELVEAHAGQDAVLESRSFRYTRPLRTLGRVLRRP